MGHFHPDMSDIELDEINLEGLNLDVNFADAVNLEDIATGQGITELGGSVPVSGCCSGWFGLDEF